MLDLAFVYFILVKLINCASKDVTFQMILIYQKEIYDFGIDSKRITNEALSKIVQNVHIYGQ